MKKLVITTFIFMLVLCISLFTPGVVNANNGANDDEYLNKTNDILSYASYKSKYPQVFPNEKIIIDVKTNYEYENGLYDDEPYVETYLDDYQDEKQGLYVPETGDISFNFNNSTEGYYNIKVYYYTVEGRSATISKGLKINDEYPFEEAKNISFSRYWKDQFDVSEKRVKDKNDFKPTQEEIRIWTEETIRDTEGFYNESYKFYFTKDSNKLTLTSNREPIVIEKIELYQETELLSYAELEKVYEQKGYNQVQNIDVKVQGESSFQKSSPTLSPVANFSSYKIEPYENFITRYNTIGGNNWRVAGDWISWEIEVPQAGLYNLTFKTLQNFNRGMSSTRKLYVNGTVPFEEAKMIEFPYSSDWQNITIGKDEDHPYQIYLEKGINVIKLESNIGVYGDIARNVDETITDLRGLYREIVMKTGLNPDPNQDYLLSRYIPDLNLRIEKSIQSLQSSMDRIIGISGQRSSMIGSFERALLQLNKFTESEKNIQNGLREFEQNLSALGNWVMSISEQPLLIDYIQAHSFDTKLPKVSTNFFQKLWHEIVMFIGSFFDTASISSNVDVDGPTITVWISTGKDQASIIRQMIDETFTREKNINVDLKLVSGGALLPATLSGNGPDVSIGVGENLPVNWGIRKAIQDLTEFDDYNEFAKSFHPSAITPYTFDGSVYALPDTQDFLVTYYREDILKEIGVEQVPKTWDEVIDLLPVLQKNYLDFYLPSVQGSVNPILFSLLSQYGGSLYLEDGKYSGLMEEESTQAFIDFTKFYSDYGFALSANFINRFRSGEMPIGVSYYTDYNTLAVFAPELNGLWNYATIPGVKKSDGTIDYTTISKTTGTVMMSNSEEKAASWEFIKWWLGEEAQLGYARNMEAILGAAARYPTANLKAFEQLPWSTKDYIILNDAREHSKGMPVVPGDYIVGRYVDNAFRAVINDKVNPYDSLYNYHIKINKELERKRKEFGL